LNILSGVEFEIFTTQKGFFLKGRILAKFSASIWYMNELIIIELISSFYDLFKIFENQTRIKGKGPIKIKNEEREVLRKQIIILKTDIKTDNFLKLENQTYSLEKFDTFYCC